MQNTNNKPYIIAGIIFLILLILILVGAWFFISRKKAADEEANFKYPTEKSVEPSVNTGSDLGSYNQKELSENKGYKIGQLSSELPYNGTNFSLTYDFDADEFTLYVNPDAEDLGNAELSAYLKGKGIQDISWITNLKRTNQKP